MPSTPAPPRAASGTRYRSTSRVEEIDVWDTMQSHHLQGDDSSSSDEGIHPRRHQRSSSRNQQQQQKQQHLAPARPRHGRSLSHPFLFFGRGRKKGDGSGDGEDDDDDDGDDDDDDYGIVRSSGGGGVSRSGNLAASGSAQRGHARGRSTAGAGTTNNSGSQDLAVGRCMTCSSLVRWPKDLPAFRCSICLTINDLPRQTVGGGHRRTGSGVVVPEVAVTGDDQSQQSELRERPISLGHSRSLVDQCLRSFLSSIVRNQTGNSPAPSPGIHSPPPHPSPASPQPSPSFLAPSGSASPLPLRPKMSLDFEPRQSLRPPRPQIAHRRAPSWAGSSSASQTPSAPDDRPPPPPPNRPPPPSPAETARRIFRPLEDYIMASVTSFNCLNRSFLIPRSHPPHHHHARRPSRSMPRRASEDVAVPRPREVRSPSTSYPVPELDPKLLLLGDVAENGTWWTGQSYDTGLLPHSRTLPAASRNSDHGIPSMVSFRSPHIDWVEMGAWYAAVLEPARRWYDMYEGVVAQDPSRALSPAALREVEAQILAAQDRVHRTLLKACETVLKRPGRRLQEPQELRFLLILAANPLLHAWHTPYRGRFQPPLPPLPMTTGQPQECSGPSTGRHSVIIKRIAGLLSNVNQLCQDYLVSWFARYPESGFVQAKELFSGFLTYRLVRQNEKKYQAEMDLIGGLVPNVGLGSSTAALHAAMGAGGGGAGSGGSRSTPNTTSQRAKKEQDKKKKMVVYREDWQIRAAAKVLSYLFAANNMGHVRRSTSAGAEGSSSYSQYAEAQGTASHSLVRAPGQILATSDFYMTLLDDSDLIADYENWEYRRHHQQQQQSQQQQHTHHLQSKQRDSPTHQSPFAFCQYPFLLSMGAKMRILQHDVRRQMETRARDAFFDSILSNRLAQQFFVLSVRRECLVEDSLRAVSEAVGAAGPGGGDIKKALRVKFLGEEGLDAGGLRKEWFLLLVREVFSPEHGLFLYDEDSGYCYFNPNALEPSEQFFLVGVVLGLALYNSIILDVALPPFAFRKLLAAAPPNKTAGASLSASSSCSPLPTTTGPPSSTTTTTTHSTHTPPYHPTLDDLSEYRPRLARGLRQLLAYEGDDVESVFCLTFSLDVDRYGAVETVPLCPGGLTRPVTSANRREYVDAYVRHLLDASVARQFEPFKRGFYTVVDTEALGLFRPEEIELLVKGAGGKEAPIDVEALRGVAVYEGWERKEKKKDGGGGSGTRSGSAAGDGTSEKAQTMNPEDTELTIRWFWRTWQRAAPADQRRLLAFITGSDRVPAAGEAALAIRVACLGDECGRFPTARTCFNSIGLWRARVPPVSVSVSVLDDGEDEDREESEAWRRERERFEEVLWRAVRESEGFGLK